MPFKILNAELSHIRFFANFEESDKNFALGVIFSFKTTSIHVFRARMRTELFSITQICVQIITTKSCPIN